MMSAALVTHAARKRVLPFLALPWLALAVLLWLAQAAHAETNAECVLSGPGAYTVTVCIETPAGVTLSGNTPVSATVGVAGSSTTAAKVIFHLDNQYLLTDYEAPYRFTLPSAEFGPYPTGTHTISVTAYLRDGFEADAPLITRTFANAGAPPPGPAFTPHTVPAPPAGESAVIAVTGDGAGGETPYIETVELIESWDPALILYAGDVYEKGSYTEFLNWYGTPGPAGTYLGRFYDITNPIVGNHEYLTLTPEKAAGYFKYWNGVPNYYSYNAAGWRFIALNSTAEFGEIGPNKPQLQWLQNEVAANTNPCTIAYFHHPVLSVGPQEGDVVALDNIWNLLVSDGVDMTFVGHDHSYQRWKPLDANLQVSSQGITQFVVGNGGHGIQPFIAEDDRLAVGFDNPLNSVGALRVKLNPKGAEFALFNTSGTLLDQGVVPCSGAAADTVAPTTPQNLAVTIAPSGYNRLTWSAAWDETGVASYVIHRNGSQIATVGGGTTSYLDAEAPFNSTYVYTVAATDPFGRTSPKSGAATIVRPGVVTLTLNPVADTYVEDGRSTPFGHLEFLRLRPTAPIQQAYLRFDVQGTEGHVTSAKLRLYKETAPVQSFNVHAVDNTTWPEATTVYTNAPALGAVVGSSGAGGVGWREIDVSDRVQDDGPVSFAAAAAAAAIRLTSREGANPPQLVVGVNAPAPPPPTAPGNLQATTPAPGRINLTWTAATSSNGIDYYVVQRDDAHLVTLSGDQLSYTDAAVAPDTTYKYSIVAVNFNGAQSPPSEITVTTQPTPPPTQQTYLPQIWR